MRNNTDTTRDRPSFAALSARAGRNIAAILAVAAIFTVKAGESFAERPADPAIAYAQPAMQD